MKQLRLGLAALVLLLALVATATAEENLEQWVATALANNPEIGAADARWQMYRERVTVAGALEDPMLMLGIQNALIKDPLNFRRDPMTQKVIGISQMLPYFGKRAAKAELARHEAEVQHWQLEERKLELAQMVKETGYRLYSIDHSLVLTKRTIQLLDELLQLAESRYSVGQGMQQEVLQAQVERSKMQDMLLVLERQRRGQQAVLNELLARPQSTPVGALPELSTQPLALTTEGLQAQALAHRPQLRSLTALMDKSRAGRKLADLEYYPDFTVNFEYMQRDRLDGEMPEGDDMYGVSVSFNLPVQREKRRAMVQEAAAESSMAAAELSMLRNAIERGIAERLADLDQRAGQVRLYREAILPQAEGSLEAAFAAYRVGQLDFSMLLDSQMALFTYQRQYHEMLADYHMTLAQLEALVGGALLH